MSISDKGVEVAIIGVGFSGLMTAYHLIKDTTVPLTLHLINDKDTFGRGAAYSTKSLKHLLNVPAAKMSAILDDPNHFLEWAHQLPAYESVNKDTLGKAFLPRKIFGNYFNSIWEEALKNKRADTVINIIHDSAVDIDKVNNEYLIKTKAGATVHAHYVVLATGNETPANPRIKNETFYQSSRYIKNPWLTDVTKYLKPNEDLLIIGNGLTTVDLLITIMSTGYTGHIHTLSPSGWAVLPHRHNHLEYKNLINEIQEPYTLDDIYTKMMKHYRLLHKVGISIEPIVDSLRSHTHKIWKALSHEDKVTFLRDIKTNWNKVRHRIAPQLFDYVQNLQIKGKLIVHRADLLDIKEDTTGITVSYLNRYNRKTETLHTGQVVNCTGPHIDITKSEDPLLQSLVAKGMIQPDKLRIGMDVTDQWTLIDKDGHENPTLYTIGGNLRGLLWETTAVPELKVQSSVLAKAILAKLTL